MNCPGITRRSFLADTGMGFTGLVLGSMLFRDGVRAESPASAWQPPTGAPHFTPRAKSVIWIFLCGGVSHVESFDVKPELTKYAGKSISETPYAGVVATEGKDVIGANPAHGNRKVLMALNTGFDAQRARKGYHLNAFFYSLMKAENRAEFLADERKYLQKFPMTDEQRDAVVNRDWNRLLELGGVSYAIVKLAFTDKKSYQYMASQMVGITEKDYVKMMQAGGRSLDGWRSKSERKD